jgi:hypothetical protein
MLGSICHVLASAAARWENIGWKAK